MKVIFYLFFILILSSCSTFYYYSYGTSININEEFIVDDYYKFGDYEFSSIIKNKTSVPFNLFISTGHISYSLVEPNDFNSYIYLSNETGKTIIIKNVKLVHKDTNGNIISPITEIKKTENIELLNNSTFYYRLEYDKVNLPKDIIEEVEINIQMDGETYSFVETYKLEWVKMILKWDAWMSI